MKMNKKNITLFSGFLLTACVTTNPTNNSLPPSSSASSIPKTVQNDSVTKNNSSLDPVAMVAAHNQWRSKTGVPDLKWLDELAEAAQKWANHLAQSSCTPGHSGGKYGENIYIAGPATSSDGSTKIQNITAQNVVDAWGNEIKDYDYSDNSCHYVCGHYTQVVWKTTTEVGCGMATCKDKSQLWVCQYTPAGNMIGEKPY